MNHTFPPQDVTFHLDTGSPRLVSVTEKETLIHRGESCGTLLVPEEAPVWGEHFDRTLQTFAPRTAGLVAGVTRQIMEHHAAPVLVSLARGGTPAVVLIRREARRLGLDWPYHSVSIMRGEGLDVHAYREVLGAHPEREVVFVDGWTGQGSIQAALNASVSGVRLAVLSDPAGVSTYAGTYEDVLIPHALLNATVCGLLSRTFLQGRGRHAVILEKRLKEHDRTAAYLDAVSHATPVPQERGRRPGNPVAYTLAIAGMYGVTDSHRITPSVGEASRALLRRAPCELLLRQWGHPDTQHLEDVARRRGVAVYVHSDLPYQACILMQ
ncbi:cysteine protease StiP family protein (plasmid) [Deinococcus taeanensis]|uniref:cysteine protease StiP domain-containing protein n=1 Tax=Deinococcus taeanensis TaxID=2737050 RepID=UPI001CDBC0CB|nr:cysteine protease StiP domain-containing protein [Deinococcus taeanensis]UBV44778.1 cysteine protease StiP family protein [Deinococcus taeanensis]